MPPISRQKKDSLINSAGLKHASGSQEDKEKGARPCIDKTVKISDTF